MDKMLENKIKNCVEEGVQFLDEKYSLPNDGVLSGGALCNTIFQLKNNLDINNAVINDIDIFKYNIISDDKATYRSNKLKEKTNNGKESLKDVHEQETYDNISYSDDKDNFIAFNNEQKQDIFNYIQFDSNINNYYYLLKSFDINCCQIGYNLETKEIYYTNDWEDFFINNELKCVNPTSPPNVVCRLFKKKKDLGNVKLNIKEELNYLKFSYNIVPTPSRILINKRFNNTLFENIDIIEKYFKLDTYYGYNILYPKEWKANKNELLVNTNRNTWFKKKEDSMSKFLNKKDLEVYPENYDFFYRTVMKNKNLLKIWIYNDVFLRNLEYLEGYNYNDEKQLYYIIGRTTDILKFLKEHDDNFISFSKMNLKEQIKAKKIIENKIEENEKYSYLLRYIETPLIYNNEKDFKFQLTTFLIKYRKDINKYQNRINNKTEDNSDYFDLEDLKDCEFF